MNRKSAFNYFNGFLETFYMFYDELYVDQGTVSLATLGVNRKPNKQEFDLNPERYTEAVFRYYKFNVMVSSSHFSPIPYKVSNHSSFGKCFALYRQFKMSMPCYIRWNPMQQKLIKKNLCKM